MKKRRLEASIFGDPLSDDPEPSGRATTADHDDAAEVSAPRRRAEQRSEARLAQRRRRKSRRRLVVMVLAVALVAGASAAAFFGLRPLLSSLSASNDYVGAGSGSVSVVVKGGDAGRTIGAALEKAGVVKSAKSFSDASAKDPRSAGIQPGTYTLRFRMSGASALAMLLDPANRTIPKVTIREGLWTAETIRALSDGTGQPLADYVAALKDPAMLGLPAAAKGNVEGYLFPSTYEFEKDATAVEQLHTMVAKCLAELDRLGVAPDKAQRVLTIASIVEAEAKASADRPKVSRVIENRLAKPMLLQMDSTVHFISQRRGKAGTTDSERRSRSPYNTYVVPGLPPGPINSPGVSAMTAAVRPTPGAWLYFVAVNPETGETRFAVDAAGHEANVKLFQKWCTDHPGRC